MDPKNNSIITEDGQRLTINEGLITGTEDPGPGLAYEITNMPDENKRAKEEKGNNVCPNPNDRSVDKSSKI